MGKNKRFLAGFLAAALVLQPVAVMAEDAAAQEEFNAAENISDETDIFGGEEQETAAYSFLEEELEENGFSDEINLEEAQNIVGKEKSIEAYLEDTVEAPISVTNSSENVISFFSNGYYNGSYGEQLELESKRLYDRMVEKYATHYADGIDQEEYTKLTFSLSEKIYFDATLDEDNNIVMDDNFMEAKNQLKYYIQAAVDAFSYDHPEVFWFRGGTFKARYGYRKKEDGTIQGYFDTEVELNVGNKEIETDAHKEMPEFMASVNATVDRLRAEIGTATTYEKIKRIHDYVCELATYKGADDPSNLVVHTAKPAFLGTDHGFVCEGYAKTIKILCDYLGVNCACIGGTAKSKASSSPGAHMWNYIRMDDGNWYLVDATWDDSKDPAVPYTNYFLAGWDSMGFHITIREERTENGVLSVEGGKAFIYPLLSDKAYQKNAENTENPEDPENPGDAGKPGSTEEPGDAEKPGDTNDTEPPAECQHNWKLETVVKEPTCTEEGSGISRCSVCGEKKEEPVSIPASGHTYGEYVVTKAPTVLETGIKTASCTRCGGTITASVDKVPRTIQLSVTSFRLRVGQSYTVKVSGLGAGDKVKSWKSNNTRIATVNSKGKITGKKSGTTTITVTLKSGLTKKIKVRVQTGIVKTGKISLNTRKVKLARKGRTFQLKVTVLPVTSQQKVTYTSSRPTVAAVNSKGKITAKKKGTTTITATSGTKKITCKVTVLK